MDIFDIILHHLAKISEDKKSPHIRIYKPFDGFVADYVLVIGAQNLIHVKALATDLEKCLLTYAPQLPTHFFDRPKLSGNGESGWMILDSLSIVIHIMTNDVRHFYEIDSLFEERSRVYEL